MSAGSSTGRVVEVFGATVPDTNRPARKVVIDRGEDRPWAAFWIPVGNDPPVGATIAWGPHHAWWDGHQVEKLTWLVLNDAPLSPA